MKKNYYCRVFDMGYYIVYGKNGAPLYINQELSHRLFLYRMQN